MQQTTIISTALFFLIIFSFGYWLTGIGKPYKGVTMNVHKLVALAALAYLIVVMVQVNKVTPLNTVQWIVCGLTALFFIGAIVTGGLVSLARTMPKYVTLLHKLFPWFTLFSTIAALYLLLA
jgi:hypothetical protein